MNEIVMSLITGTVSSIIGGLITHKILKGRERTKLQTAFIEGVGQELKELAADDSLEQEVRDELEKIPAVLAKLPDANSETDTAKTLPALYYEFLNEAAEDGDARRRTKDLAIDIVKKHERKLLAVTTVTASLLVIQVVAIVILIACVLLSEYLWPLYFAEKIGLVVGVFVAVLAIIWASVENYARSIINHNTLALIAVSMIGIAFFLAYHAMPQYIRNDCPPIVTESQPQTINFLVSSWWEDRHIYVVTANDTDNTCWLKDLRPPNSNPAWSSVIDFSSYSGRRCKIRVFASKTPLPISKVGSNSCDDYIKPWVIEGPLLDAAVQ